MKKKDEFEWSTALGIVESAEKMYTEAVSNGNIKIKK